MKRWIARYKGHFEGLKNKEILFIWLKVLIVILFVSYIFYESVVGSIILFPMALYMGAHEAIEKIDKKKKEINIQFAEMLNSVSASLQAGYSMENAFIQSYVEIRTLYGPEAYIAELIGKIIKAININMQLEEALLKMGEECGVEDVKTFAEVFKFARRSGGDMVAIIRKTSENIYEKQAVKKEIEVLISSKKLEHKIMCFIPFIIIVYMKLSMPGLLSPLYHNLLGISIMTIMLIFYFLSVRLGERIVRIEV